MYHYFYGHAIFGGPVQWLVEHRKGRQFCRVKMKKDSKHMHFLCYAAGAGSVDVMQFLYDKQYADQFVPALLSAVCKNQLAAVKWLLDHLPAEEQSAASCVIEAAARHGRLEILQYLAKLDAASSWWSPSETAMSLSSAAAGNFSDVVQWLVANHSISGGSSTAMDKAAGNGHLDMVKWLHMHGFKCSVAAMDGAAANGHLEMVRWLNKKSSAGCTTHAMDLAAGRGHLDVLKWLHRNRSEGCTEKAMTNAVEQGHVRVVSWLHDHFPNYSPQTKQLLLEPPNEFEMALFLHQHFPKAFRHMTIGVYEDRNDDLVMGWLTNK